MFSLTDSLPCDRPVLDDLACDRPVCDRHDRSNPWATLRFRRAQNRKGWVLLGIPTTLYPQVLHRLLEAKAQCMAKHCHGSFVNLLFEAPPTLAVTLALTFPAPPGWDPLVINEGGDRILAGKAATSAPKARSQGVDPWFREAMGA
ncbi:hypothetical protein PROH_10995 [Prochlorothrix hollandica PCC 9006 = CALU 1027]|uniref:Uncharacterized protein n=2 Tax=Prochlorothrix hollandica TaxID=1223 RepID=A0A0M2Q0P8_PROHO|nr:hypothetical protein PROH_10995 [Prochlorothrix hollandica PCC 9006 = CALU 1027]